MSGVAFVKSQLKEAENENESTDDACSESFHETYVDAVVDPDGSQRGIGRTVVNHLERPLYTISWQDVEVKARIWDTFVAVPTFTAGNRVTVCLKY